MAEAARLNGIATDLLAGFSKLDASGRDARLIALGAVSSEDLAQLRSGLPPEVARLMIENHVAEFGIPMGVAIGVPVDKRVYPAVPMVTEESSVVATVGNISRLIRERGDLSTEVLGTGSIGQIHFDYVADPAAFEEAVLGSQERIIDYVNSSLIPNMVARGGGMTGMEVRHHPLPDGTHMAVVHVIIDACDAMGANIVNQVCQDLQGPLEEITGEKVNLRILSNLADERLVSAEIAIPDFDPEQGNKIARASLLAHVDPWRAATHNKGIMNGVTAVVTATGNDTRAVEAGAHAFAARDGQYRGLSEWHMVDGTLVGRMRIPMTVGTVGGITNVHPQVQRAHAMLGNPSANELGRIISATGLIQNLGALKALTSEKGINGGHMKLHASNLAAGTGATREEIEPLTIYLRELHASTGRISPTDAQAGLQLLRAQEQGV